MPACSHSLLDTASLSAEDVQSLFATADLFRDRSQARGYYWDPEDVAPTGAKVVALLFFEPSTRTRMSFQQAAYRLGLPVLTMESASSSVSKGESLSDTVLNVLAMKPDCLVIRYGVSLELDEILPSLDVPVINAGSGASSHPTQALLDAYTILRERGKLSGKLSGERVLIVGDILHSRVARSNFELLPRLGAEIGVCGPAELIPAATDLPAGARVFRDLDEGLRWATVCMGLRIQFERHGRDQGQNEVRERIADYHRSYGINSTRLQSLAPEGILMHPGPVNHGVEFSSEVLRDPRSRVLEQVTNGVLIRAALLARQLGLDRRVGKERGPN